MKSITWLESQKHNYDYNDNNDKYVQLNIITMVSMR